MLVYWSHLVIFRLWQFQSLFQVLTEQSKQEYGFGFKTLSLALKLWAVSCSVSGEGFINGIEAVFWFFWWWADEIRCKALFQTNEADGWHFYCWRSTRVLGSLQASLWYILLCFLYWYFHHWSSACSLYACYEIHSFLMFSLLWKYSKVYANATRIQYIK